MHIASLLLDLRLESCRTAGQRRRVVRSMVVRLRRHFNVSAAEDDRTDRPDQARLVVAAVGRTRREAREVLERVAAVVEAHPLAEPVGRLLDDL